MYTLKYVNKMINIDTFKKNWHNQLVILSYNTKKNIENKPLFFRLVELHSETLALFT